MAVVLLFFTFSTTQEYYSMVLYPGAALLLGSAMTMEGSLVRVGTRIISIVAGLAATTIAIILILTRNLPVRPQGDSVAPYEKS